MGILDKFKEMFSSSDSLDNPNKLVKEYEENVKQQIGKLNAETESAIAEEQRIKRELDEVRDDFTKMDRYAKRAEESGDESGARRFLERKNHLEVTEKELQLKYEHISKKVQSLRELQEQLSKDMSEMEFEDRFKSNE